MAKKSIVLSVIIPCYNEEKNIRECVKRVPHFSYSYEIIVVNDGSKDNTAKVARSIKRKELKIVSYDKNRGKGYAFKQGIKKAVGNFVICCDADMATMPEEIPLVIEPLIRDEVDFVNTSRLLLPMEKGAMKSLHVPGNYMFAILVSLIIRKKLTDTLSGFKAFRRTKLLGKLKEDSWPDFEMLFQARKQNLRITEVPIHYKARRAGASKMKTFSHGFKMLGMLIEGFKLTYFG